MCVFPKDRPSPLDDLRTYFAEEKTQREAVENNRIRENEEIMKKREALKERLKCLQKLSKSLQMQQQANLSSRA